MKVIQQLVKICRLACFKCACCVNFYHLWWIKNIWIEVKDAETKSVQCESSDVERNVATKMQLLNRTELNFQWYRVEAAADCKSAKPLLIVNKAIFSGNRVEHWVLWTIGVQTLLCPNAHVDGLMTSLWLSCEHLLQPPGTKLQQLLFPPHHHEQHYTMLRPSASCPKNQVTPKYDYNQVTKTHLIRIQYLYSYYYYDMIYIAPISRIESEALRIWKITSFNNAFDMKTYSVCSPEIRRLAY